MTNSYQRLSNGIFKNKIFYNNNLMKYPNGQFCRISGSFGVFLSIKKNFWPRKCDDHASCWHLQV